MTRAAHPTENRRDELRAKLEELLARLEGESSPYCMDEGIVVRVGVLALAIGYPLPFQLQHFGPDQGPQLNIYEFPGTSEVFQVFVSDPQTGQRRTINVTRLPNDRLSNDMRERHRARIRYDDALPQLRFWLEAWLRFLKSPNASTIIGEGQAHYQPDESSKIGVGDASTIQSCADSNILTGAGDPNGQGGNVTMLGAATGAEPMDAVPKGQRVILSHGDRCYSIEGVAPFTVTVREDTVLQSFLKMPSMDHAGLVSKSGYKDAAQILASLKTRYEGKLSEAIHRPGRGRAGGYHIAIQAINNTITTP